MAVKKYRDKLSTGREALYVYHYHKKYKNGRKSIRATYNGIKLFSGKGKFYSKDHEACFELFYYEMKKKLEFQGISHVEFLESDFFEYAEKYIERKRTYRTKNNYTRSVSYFKKFVNGSINFNQLNIDYCDSFRRWLFKQESYYGDKNLSNNYIHKIISQLSTITYAAIDEEKTSLSRNPFSKLEIKVEETVNEFLEPQEIDKFINLDIEEIERWTKSNQKGRFKLFESRAYFLLCYFLGLRISDLYELLEMFRSFKKGVLKPEHGTIDIDNRIIGKLHKKTRRLTYIQINETAWSILESYNFDLPHVTSKTINLHLKILAEHLGINKSVHIHMTNHSISTNLYDMGFTFEQISDFQGKRVETLRKHYIQKNKLRTSQEINKMMPKQVINNLKKPK